MRQSFCFQAEDGIRDRNVTGVQTCALPISNPRAEFRELFLDAWRMERDFFYDRNMHGVDWPRVRDRYLPLVDRVSDRNELNDVIAQMVSELSALHIFVFGGDARKPADEIDIASLGAILRRDEKAGGSVVDHVYLHDPDLPNRLLPSLVLILWSMKAKLF